MESSSIGGSPVSSSFKYSLNAKIEVQSTIINSTLGGKSDSVDFGATKLVEGLNETAKRIVDKINELLKGKYPQGVQALKPEEASPEATADRIMKGITLLFDRYQKGREDVPKEELIDKFMSLARQGVDAGYSDAYEFLDGMGAFGFEGVKDGVEKTKILLDGRLKEFEDQLKKQFGVGQESAEIAQSVKDELLASSGSSLNVVA